MMSMIVDRRYSEAIQAELRREYAPGLRYSMGDIANGLEMCRETVCNWWSMRSNASAKTTRQLMRKFGHLDDYRGRIARAFHAIREDNTRKQYDRNVAEFSRWAYSLGQTTAPIPQYVQSWRVWDDWIESHTN